jgi:hypothetical protein
MGPPPTKNYLNVTFNSKISEVLSLILNLTPQPPGGGIGLGSLPRLFDLCQLGADVELAENGI